MARMQYKRIPTSDITSPEALGKFFSLNIDQIQAVADRYPMKITPYFLSLIQKPGEALWRQVIPDPRELEGCLESDDPLAEEKQSPVKNLVHRYPDRVLFLVSNRCAVYCRYCMRKRMMGQPLRVSEDTIREGIAYIRRNQCVREVLLSGETPDVNG